MTDENHIPEANDLPYQVKNIKYGEKTVVGRVVGRDKVVIPEDEFYQMACLFSTWKDFSEYYGVPQQTLRDNFRDLYTKARQVTKRKLRQKMLETALNGDRVMMIWLSKQWLDMRETPVETQGEQVLPWIDEPNDE